MFKNSMDCLLRAGVWLGLADLLLDHFEDMLRVLLKNVVNRILGRAF